MRNGLEAHAKRGPKSDYGEGEGFSSGGASVSVIVCIFRGRLERWGVKEKRIKKKTIGSESRAK